MDQHIEHGRAALRAAALQLLLQQPYEAISVDDIVRRAGVSRATFYVNFEDKDDMLRASLAAPFEWLSLLIADPVPAKIVAAAVARMLGVRDEGIALLQGSARPVIVRILAGHLETRLGERGLHRPGRLLLPFPMLSDMLADAILASIVEWLQTEQPMPAEDLARVLVRQAATIIDASRAG